jgi:hypothetical protein
MTRDSIAPYGIMLYIVFLLLCKIQSMTRRSFGGMYGKKRHLWLPRHLCKRKPVARMERSAIRGENLALMMRQCHPGFRAAARKSARWPSIRATKGHLWQKRHLCVRPSFETLGPSRDQAPQDEGCGWWLRINNLRPHPEEHARASAHASRRIAANTTSSMRGNVMYG